MMGAGQDGRRPQHARLWCTVAWCTVAVRDRRCAVGVQGPPRAARTGLSLRPSLGLQILRRQVAPWPLRCSRGGGTGAARGQGRTIARTESSMQQWLAAADGSTVAECGPAASSKKQIQLASPRLAIFATVAASLRPEGRRAMRRYACAAVAPYRVPLAAHLAQRCCVAATCTATLQVDVAAAPCRATCRRSARRRRRSGKRTRAIWSARAPTRRASLGSSPSSSGSAEQRRRGARSCSSARRSRHASPARHAPSGPSPPRYLACFVFAASPLRRVAASHPNLKLPASVSDAQQTAE